MDRQHRLHIGMRIIKTVIAVFLCGLLAHFRGESALYSMFAALACLQNTKAQTIKSSVDRMMGTLIGGLVGIVVVHGMNALGLLYVDLLRYLVLSLLLIPIIEICLAVKKPDCATMACMVFMCMIVDPGDKPIIYSIERLFETFVGVALACGINMLLPYQQPPAEPPKAEEPPTEAPEAQAVSAKGGGEEEP